MPVIESALDPRAPEARANAEAMRALVADLRARDRRPRPARRRGGPRGSAIAPAASSCPGTGSGR